MTRLTRAALVLSLLLQSVVCQVVVITGATQSGTDVIVKGLFDHGGALNNIHIGGLEFWSPAGLKMIPLNEDHSGTGVGTVGPYQKPIPAGCTFVRIRWGSPTGSGNVTEWMKIYNPDV